MLSFIHIYNYYYYYYLVLDKKFDRVQKKWTTTTYKSIQRCTHTLTQASNEKRKQIGKAQSFPIQGRLVQTPIKIL